MKSSASQTENQDKSFISILGQAEEGMSGLEDKVDGLSQPMTKIRKDEQNTQDLCDTVKGPIRNIIRIDK